MLLDPVWDTPRNKRDELLQYLKDVQNSVNNNGRVKPKRLYQMIRVFTFSSPVTKFYNRKHDFHMIFILKDFMNIIHDGGTYTYL